MRKITILVATAAFLVMVAGVAGQVHTSTEGQGPFAGAGVDPVALHRQVDTKTLPQLELAPEIFQ